MDLAMQMASIGWVCDFLYIYWYSALPREHYPTGHSEFIAKWGTHALEVLLFNTWSVKI